ncbi:hypothetical protein AYL99_10651 [Fonsecaea erecta]|uniref:Uncharacterized protein n=1 Tax=Fonsecaea erecta TaxID=1367422 RepID=A0A178Z605_9EURO|nr:hypothetical protein AYL99_10651 [Fonsecaea erecta]OAP54951.1 hypothetical protein AYL99_10651 [Fonsecaea erecta]
MATLLWVTKSAQSQSLSQSEGQERLDIFSQAQAVSRHQKAASRKQATTTLYRVNTAVTTGRKHVFKLKNFQATRGSRHPGLGHANPDHRYCACTSPWLPLTPSYPIQRNHDWTVHERRSASYFQEVAVNKILTVQRHREFWKGIVPCLVESEPGIRHLVVAIAATYEFLQRPRAVPLDHFALTQCNKALRTILSGETNRQSLITSSILVATYHLLRAENEAADRAIDSGLKMLQLDNGTDSGGGLEQLSSVLMSIGQQHGYKLWAADVAFLFEKTVANCEDIRLVQHFPSGPFTNGEQVLSSFKAMMMEVIARVMRNITLGAYVDPDCSFACDVGQHFSTILFHWDMLYRSLPANSATEKLQLVQVKVGLLLARLLFHAKLLAADELRVDAYAGTFAEICRLGKEVIASRHAGRPVVYVDRFVNGTFFTCAMLCRDPQIRRDFISLLKSQLGYQDGLVNYARGHVAMIMADIEEHGLVVDSCHDIPETKRIGVCELSCSEDRVLRLGYMAATWTERTSLNHHFSRIPAELNDYTHQEINECLKGMMGAYAMYRKLDLFRAPNGYLRKMYYGELLVRVIFRPGIVVNTGEALDCSNL